MEPCCADVFDQNVMFNRIDANHDGVLSTEELVARADISGRDLEKEAGTVLCHEQQATMKIQVVD